VLSCRGAAAAKVLSDYGSKDPLINSSNSRVARKFLRRVLINRDCLAIAGCRKRRVRIASGALLPPSPPAEQATASQYEARQSGTDDWAGDGKSGVIQSYG